MIHEARIFRPNEKGELVFDEVITSESLTKQFWDGAETNLAYKNVKRSATARQSEAKVKTL